MNGRGVDLMVMLALGCALVGLAAGWARGRSIRPSAGRMFGTLALLAIALPVVLILLAKLFDSNTLGLVFGATLIAEALALPFAALFGAGWSIGSALGRRRRAVSSSDELMACGGLANKGTR